MKKAEKILIGGFLLAVLFSFFGFSANCERISEKVLRMHILANSDSEYDQRIKIVVKDAVAQCTGEMTAPADNLEDAEVIIENNLEIIENVANQKLEQLGTSYKAKAIIEDTYFGTREYESFSLPAGEYRALRVLLGTGSGKNWWCVVYPSLCIPAATENDFKDFSGSEEKIIQNPADYKVSFKVYEWYTKLRKLFGN